MRGYCLREGGYGVTPETLQKVRKEISLGKRGYAAIDYFRGSVNASRRNRVHVKNVRKKNVFVEIVSVALHVK